MNKKIRRSKSSYLINTICDVNDEPKVIYEDKNYYGIYKPACWIVNVGNYNNKSTWDVLNPRNKHRKLLQLWLYKNLDYPLRTKIDYGYGISNRLDKETSGIVIVAKNKKAYKHIRSQINDHTTIKKYKALVRGIILKKQTLENNMDCISIGNSKKCFVCPTNHGKYAKTIIKPIKYYTDNEKNMTFTLLKIRIFTGRTHQIRVHTDYINHHVFADPIYNFNKLSAIDERKLLNRFFLHAYSYSFINLHNKRVTIRSELPIELLNLIKSLDELCITIKKK